MPIFGQSPVERKEEKIVGHHFLVAPFWPHKHLSQKPFKASFQNGCRPADRPVKAAEFSAWLAECLNRPEWSNKLSLPITVPFQKQENVSFFFAFGSTPAWGPPFGDQVFHRHLKEDHDLHEFFSPQPLCRNSKFFCSFKAPNSCFFCRSNAVSVRASCLF